MRVPAAYGLLFWGEGQSALWLCGSIEIASMLCGDAHTKMLKVEEIFMKSVSLRFGFVISQGAIDAQAVATVAAAVGYPISGSEIIDMVAAMDSDRDGRIKEDDMVAFLASAHR